MRMLILRGKNNKNFFVVGFLQFLSLSQDIAPQAANFAIFEVFLKFNA